MFALSLCLVSFLGQEPSSSPYPVDLTIPKAHVQDLAALRNKIRPPESEMRYASIDWVPSFAEGLLEAGKQQKLLLFWAMNGHPLGCT